MSEPAVVCFSMAEDGHFQRLRALVAGIARRGIPTIVFTDRRFEADVARAGGRFVDLFAQCRLEEADEESLPVPCRFVTFAGGHAEPIIRQVEALRPALVVTDGFAVIGRVVAAALGLPYVNVCAGHDVEAGRYRAMLETDPRVRLSPRCHQAAARLRDVYGMRDASPFSYVAKPSPFLNVYCEPEEYLGPASRTALEPVVFFGSLPPRDELPSLHEPSALDAASPFGAGPAAPRVYASFGTVVWRYWAREATVALAAIADAVAAMPHARAVLSLGRAAGADPDVARRLTRPNVTVASYVDQWRTLRAADVFVTHHGLSSTHEAIFCGVPMISYPFFWDQPSLAAKCAELGFAVPLSTAARGPVEPADVAAALAAIARRRPEIGDRLAAARAWEFRTIDGRSAVIDRVVALRRAAG